jgi:hypothetical protein
MADLEPIVVSWSEIDSARQCPLKHFLQYKERWREPTMGPALAKGILFHEVQEAHYRFVRNWQGQPDAEKVTDDQIRKAIEAGGLDDWANSHPVGRDHMKAIWPLLHQADGSQDDFQSLISWMFEGYLLQYGFDQQWKILAVEHGAEYPLFDNGEPTRFRIKVKIDLLANQMFRGIPRLVMIDHKSGKDLPGKKELAFADQFGLYEWCLRQVGRPPFMSIWNAVRTQRNKDDSLDKQPLDTRMGRTTMNRESIELENIAQEATETVKMMYEYYGDRRPPRTPDSDTCKWKCGFSEPCLASRKGIDLRQFLVTSGFQQDFTRH